MKLSSQGATEERNVGKSNKQTIQALLFPNIILRFLFSFSFSFSLSQKS